MCGICGVVTMRVPVSPETLQRMVATVSHRGPDGQGIRMLDDAGVQVGLGHTRLKVIDLSPAAAQPMANDEGSVWLVFNGEIYNYRELREELVARGIRCRTASDTEVLLRWYEVEGEQCVTRLEGMFAFAVWDGRSRRLLLARDRVGKKPLFYWLGPSSVAFASEIKALFQVPGIAPEVDEEALPAFFRHGYVPSPRTIYRGILKLPPGHLAVWTPEGSLRLETYWDLPVVSNGHTPLPSEAEARDQVRELVTAAVRRRLIADVPLGAWLSGGLDSTIIVGLMSRLTPEPVRTFSIGFAGDRRFDETAFARLAARRFRTLHMEFVVEPSSIALVEQLVWAHDGPFADSSAIPTAALSRLTRQHVTVALSGDGGDELFAGYERFAAALAAERLPPWARVAASRLGAALPASGRPKSALHRVRRFAEGAALPLGGRLSRWAGVFADDLPRLLPQMAASSGIAPAASDPLDPYLARAQEASPLARLLYANVKTYLLDDLLVKMDRCSMASALEVRSPFLDRALMEYVFTLPDQMKLRGWSTKRILRQAFADLVPPQILRRGKMGFGVPLHAWFGDSLREMLQEMLLAPQARLRRYVDHTYVRILFNAHMSGRADHTHRLWTLLTVELWLRQLPQWTQRPTPPVVSKPLTALPGTCVITS